MKMKTKHRRWAPALLLGALLSPLLKAETPIQAAPPALASFKADYAVYRAGKQHGTAQRYLKLTEQGYQLGYSSDISWMIFTDKRQETSDFSLQDGRIQPERYVLQRSGTGPNRYYELNLDPVEKTLSEGKKRTVKQVSWQDDWLDQLSYQLQLVLDLKAGKTEFHYKVLNRNGNAKMYHYKVVAEEILPLPYGRINTLRIARIEQNSDKQIYAWVAPELDYMLVRLWRGEDNVEQFDVQLHKLDFTQDPPPAPAN
ncbi:DUF3108 domain-containing protein [Rheinheimera nanhaiensis]|uniref:DUF3108 domain-containing protein n=1 Tax=Rheinheimera nanhaiensis TaxID=1163621 RepID=UPI001ED9B840|nr:DUF3108 domain-containing protein [Rheinheimera nanhaiensis]